MKTRGRVATNACVVGALVSVFLAAFAPARARADAPRRRTAIFRFDLDGKVSEVAREQLSQRLVESLAANDFQVFASEGPVREMLKERPALATCSTQVCFREIATALLADYLVIARVEIKQKNYDISLELVAGRNGETIASSREHCDICGFKEASETMGVAAAGLRGGLVKTEAPGQITLETQPAGALITVDGKPVGYAPLTFDESVGYHELEVIAQGYEPAKRSFEVTPGSHQEMNFVLIPQPVPRFTHVPWRTIGWASVGVGVALIAGGVAVLVGHHCAALVDSVSTCETSSRNSAALGAGLVGVGGIATGIGLISFFAARVTTPAFTPAAAPPTAATASAGDGWMLFSRGTF